MHQNNSLIKINKNKINKLLAGYHKHYCNMAITYCAMKFGGESHVIAYSFWGALRDLTIQNFKTSLFDIIDPITSNSQQRTCNY